MALKSQRFLNGLRVISTVALLITSTAASFAKGVEIKSFGHSSLLITGEGKSLLINPFKAVGCAKGLNEPRISANIILASSELADEGAQIARGKFLVQPGSYRIKGINLEGFAAPHDRVGGRRFGNSTLWRWKQGGLNFAHLGGTAAPLTGANKVLIGRPDVLIIGVGGGAKIYNGLEAANIVNELKPKRVIPVQYIKEGVKIKDCDLSGIKLFLDSLRPAQTRQHQGILSLPSKLKEDMVIEIIN